MTQNQKSTPINKLPEGTQMQREFRADLSKRAAAVGLDDEATMQEVVKKESEKPEAPAKKSKKK